MKLHHTQKQKFRLLYRLYDAQSGGILINGNFFSIMFFHLYYLSTMQLFRSTYKNGNAEFVKVNASVKSNASNIFISYNRKAIAVVPQDSVSSANFDALIKSGYQDNLNLISDAKEAKF